MKIFKHKNDVSFYKIFYATINIYTPAFLRLFVNFCLKKLFFFKRPTNVGVIFIYIIIGGRGIFHWKRKGP